MSTANNGPARGTLSYCITCSTYFKNTKGAMKHIVENYLHEAFYIDAMDLKSREGPPKHELAPSRCRFHLQRAIERKEAIEGLHKL